jgi:hypothetical protein
VHAPTINVYSQVKSGDCNQRASRPILAPVGMYGGFGLNYGALRRARQSNIFDLGA